MRWFITCCAALVALAGPATPAAAQEAGMITGTITDRHTGAPVDGACAVASVADEAGRIAGEAITDAAGAYTLTLAPGSYRVALFDCAGADYTGGWAGDAVEVVAGAAADASGTMTTTDLPGLVNVATGRWYLAAARDDEVVSFYFGNPGDLPMVGDWDCDGVDTPGLYRQSDGYVYLRNSNTQGVADVRFYFGDPGDVPLAGDFDGDGCDTVSVYRPATSQVFVVNELGAGDAGLGAAEAAHTFGVPGDQPFVGDFDGDGVDSVGMYRAAAGRVHLRNDLSGGGADQEFTFGDPGDVVLSGDFGGLRIGTPAVWRPGERRFLIRHENRSGEADRTEAWPFADPTWLPVTGVFGL